MLNRNSKDTLNALKDEFGQPYIIGLAHILYSSAQVFIVNRRLTKAIFVDEKILEQCLIDTLFDLYRLRHFHGITQENIIKIYSYSAYWWIRRKPFQRREKCGNAGLFANELFAEQFLMSALPHSLSDVNKYWQDKASSLSAHLQYHLKYRDTHPQTLELMLAGLDAAL